MIPAGSVQYKQSLVKSYFVYNAKGSINTCTTVLVTVASNIMIKLGDGLIVF